MAERNVKHRSSQLAPAKIKQPRVSSSKAKRFFEVQKQRRITAFKLVIAAMACYLGARFIKYLLYSVFFTGNQEPSSYILLLVLYVQSALLIATFGFLVFSLIKVIQYLIKYEG